MNQPKINFGEHSIMIFECVLFIVNHRSPSQNTYDLVELPRHIDVEDSYFTSQYFPTKVELPCYPPSS